MEQDGQAYVYHADGLGSIVALTDANGEVVQHYTYTAFGTIAAQSDASVVQPYTFTAREFDADTGLYYYRARTYDAATGRFLQRDPIGFVGGDLNLYGYVFQNPVNGTDPSGLRIYRRLPTYNTPEGFEKILNELGGGELPQRFKDLLYSCLGDPTNQWPFVPGPGIGTVKFSKKMLSEAEKIAEGTGIRKVHELVEQFGGKARDWVKKKGWDAHGQEWHWYENKGRRVGLKRAGEPDPF